MTPPDSQNSPRYFLEKNRSSEDSRSDRGTGPALRLRMELRGRRKPAPLRERVNAALEILAVIAARDADRASKRNGRGFSRADSGSGHRLSKLPADVVLHDPALSSAVLNLAAKYRRQVLVARQLDLL